MDIFQRFIFGSTSSGTEPRVWLVWNNGNTNQDDLICTQAQCNYQIYCGRSDLDNDIVKVEILMSTDLGITWNSIISSLGGHTFGDQLSSGAKWYKAIATDSEGNKGTSNILKITKQNPKFGDLVLVYNNVEYQEWDMSQPGLPNPINMTGAIGESAIIGFQLKNKHTQDFIQFVGVNMSVQPYDTNALFIHKYGETSIRPNLLTSPQDGKQLLPNEQLTCSFKKGSHTGLYVINISQVIGQLNGVNIPGSISWLINI